jgi:tetratricopeptide (TPR) repeat protein
MRLVLDLWKLAQDQDDEQAARAVLEAHSGTAVAFLRREDRRDQDGWQEAQAIVQNRVSVLVEDGKLYEQSGLPAEATRMYKEAYDLAPDRLDLLPRLVEAYLKEGLEFEARTAVRLAQQRYPDQAGTWLATAKVHEQGGQLEEAVKAYQEAFAIDPSIEDLRLAIGNLLMRLGRDAEASEFLRAGVNTAEAKPEVVFNYAVSLMRDGKFHAAIPSLRTVVKELPQMQQAWVALAQCLQNTGQNAAAVESFEQANALQPDPKLIFQAAASAQKAGLNERAIADYQAALQQDPTYAKALYNLALVLMDAGRYPEAAASFDQLIQLEGATYRAYYSQGLSYFYMEDTARALEAFELAMAIQETPEVLNNIGLVYDKMGDKKEAQIWYRLAKATKGGP